MLSRLSSIIFVVVATSALPASSYAQADANACTAPRPPQAVLPAVIPIEIRNGHVTFRVCRDTTQLTFVLDTGAGMSIFDLETARALGVELGAAGRVNGGGAGTSVSAQVPHDSVTIPGAAINVPVTTAVDFRSLTGPEGGAMQGILGANFIARYVVAIDYRNSQLRLYDRSAFKYTGSGTTVPITLRGSFVFVNAEVTVADGSKIPGTFVVDVGSSLSLALAKPFVENNRLRTRIGPTVRRPSGRGVGGVAVADIGRVKSLNIGGVELQQPIASLYGDSAGVFSNSNLGDGNIGGDILRRFTVYFDYQARTMILEPHDGSAEPFEADMSGLALNTLPDGGGLLVEFVLGDSPAAHAGFAKGDVVTAIDGQPATGKSLEALRKRFRREGEQISATVKRSGQSLELRFVTRRIV